MVSRRATWWRLAGAGMTLAVLVGLSGGAAAAATPRPVTISVAPASGPPGLPVAISGTGYAAGTTYGLCILPAGKTKCGYEGANLIGGAPAEQFTAGTDGTIPAGTTGTIPDLVAGSYRVVSTAPGTGFIVASADFTVTAPTFALTPASGPAGLQAAVSLTGAAPGARYTICASAKDATGCGGTGILLGDVTTDAAGGAPAGTTVVIPGQLPATYQVGIYLANSNNVFLASVAFVETAPTFALAASSGPVGSVVGVSGTGYAPGAKYAVCLFTADATSCGGGINLVGFTADASGAIPSGLVATIQGSQSGPARIGVVTDGGAAVFYLVSAPFEVLAGTPAPTVPAAASAAATPGLATVAPAPSAATTASDAGTGSGVPWLLLVILFLLILAAAFWWSRRRRDPSGSGPASGGA